MTPRDRADFAVLMTQALAFYRQDTSDFALSVWWEACQSCALEQVRKALTAHAMDPERGQFPPKPADIVRQLQGTHIDRALLAWGRAYEAMKSIGAYQSPDLGDPIAHAVIVDMGGWPALCRSDLDALPFTQKRFCDTYRTYATRGVPAETPKRLIGESEASNAKLSIASGLPVPRLAADVALKAIGSIA
jgi:hypothetical protein